MNFCVSDADGSRDPLVVACNAESLQENRNLNLKKLSDLKDGQIISPAWARIRSCGRVDGRCQWMDKNCTTPKARKTSAMLADELKNQSISGVTRMKKTEGLLTYQQMLFNRYKVLSLR